MKKLFVALVMVIMTVLCFQDIVQSENVQVHKIVFRNSTICNGKAVSAHVPAIVRDWMKKDGFEFVGFMYINSDPTFYETNVIYSWFVSFSECRPQWVIWSEAGNIQGWLYKDGKVVANMSFRAIVDKLSEINFELFVSELNE